MSFLSERGNGVYGIIALLVNNRMRDVGIRKILGSSVPSLILLLSKRYFLLAFVSLAFGLPLAYSIIDVWLSSFSYRATVSWWIYAGSASALILLVSVTILYRIRSVSAMNPVRVIRAD